MEAAVSLDSHQSAGSVPRGGEGEPQGHRAERGAAGDPVDPQEITFTLEPLTEKQGGRVTPDLSGTPAYGYELVQSVLTPQNVVIRGAKSRVQGVDVPVDGGDRPHRAHQQLCLPGEDPPAEHAREDCRGRRRRISARPSRRPPSSTTFERVRVVPVDLSPHLALKTAPPAGQPEGAGHAARPWTRSIPSSCELLLDLGGVRRAGHVHPADRGREAVPGVMVLDWSPREVTVDIVASGKVGGTSR